MKKESETIIERDYFKCVKKKNRRAVKRDDETCKKFVSYLKHTHYLKG